VERRKKVSSTRNVEVSGAREKDVENRQGFYSCILHGGGAHPRISMGATGFRGSTSRREEKILVFNPQNSKMIVC